MTQQPEAEILKEKHDKHAKEQFEVLGRFIQDFELMVDGARMACVLLVASSPKHQDLLNIIFHHNSMTAGPLFEIQRSLYGQIIKDPSYNFPSDHAAVVTGVLTQLATEYQDLTKIRNTMVHGTWHIGWGGTGDEDFSVINLSKFTAKATGLAAVEVPKSVGEIAALSARCKKTKFLMGLLLATFQFPGGPRVKNNFHKENGAWIATTATGF